MIDGVRTTSKKDPFATPIKPALTLPPTNNAIAFLAEKCNVRTVEGAGCGM